MRSEAESQSVTKPAIFRIEGAVVTHRGRVRIQNEDAALFGSVFAGSDLGQPQLVRSNCDPWLIAVADGIGGSNAGRVASRQLLEWLKQSADKSATGVVKLLQECNVRLFEQGRSNPDLAGMGAVVAGIVCGSEYSFAFNVGDSRVYRVRDGFLEQITRDDSTAQLLVDAGLAERDAQRNEKVHGIMQAIGGRFDLQIIEPHVYPLRITSLSRFLLCTDGLTDMIDLDGLEATIHGRATPAEAAAALFGASMAAGGKDNVTIIVADVNLG